jgi:hypothetical protein
MSFARAVRGGSLRSDSLKIVQDQAEIELSRKLSQEEIAQLTAHSSLTALCDKIQQVILYIVYCSTSHNMLLQYGYGYLKFQLLICNKQNMPCAVSPTPTPGDGNCLIHGN